MNPGLAGQNRAQMRFWHSRIAGQIGDGMTLRSGKHKLSPPPKQSNWNTPLGRRHCVTAWASKRSSGRVENRITYLVRSKVFGFVAFPDSLACLPIRPCVFRTASSAIRNRFMSVTSDRLVWPCLKSHIWIIFQPRGHSEARRKACRQVRRGRPAARGGRSGRRRFPQGGRARRNASSGVRQASAFPGRASVRSCTDLTSASVTFRKSVPLGRYPRTRPLVCPVGPRSQEW